MPPVSSARLAPTPSMYTSDPSGITLGSTAISPTLALVPIAVVPPPVYAYAFTTSLRLYDWPSKLILVPFATTLSTAAVSVSLEISERDDSTPSTYVTLYVTFALPSLPSVTTLVVPSSSEESSFVTVLNSIFSSFVSSLIFTRFMTIFIFFVKSSSIPGSTISSLPTFILLSLSASPTVFASVLYFLVSPSAVILKSVA